MAESNQLKPKQTPTLDGGKADNTHKWILPQNTTDHLAEISPSVGSIAFDTDLQKMVINDGTGFAPVSPGGGGGGADTQLSNLTAPTLIPVNLNFAPGLANATLQTPDGASASITKNILVHSGNNTAGSTGTATFSTGNSTTGSSGTIQVRAGSAATNGGAASLIAGNTSGVANNAGNINLAAGLATNVANNHSAGDIFINAGNNAGPGTGGSVNITSGSGGTPGDINLTSSGDINLTASGLIAFQTSIQLEESLDMNGNSIQNVNEIDDINTVMAIDLIHRRLIADDGSTVALAWSGGTPGFVGIGTITPDFKLEVDVSDQTPGNNAIVSTRHADDIHSGGFVGRKSRGTQLAPTPVQAGDVPALLAPSAYDGTTYNISGIAAFQIDGAVSTGVTPIGYTVWTGSAPTFGTERFRIDSAGFVGINNPFPTANDAQLHIIGSSGSTLKIVDGNQASGFVLTSDAAGQASWQAASGGGANTTLSNLGTTAINNSLLPAMPGGVSIGLPGSEWNSIYMQGSIYDGTDVKSIDITNRKLVANDGTTTIVNWSSPNGATLGGLFVNSPTGAADPAGAVAGSVYYNTITNKLKLFNGTTWETITSA